MQIGEGQALDEGAGLLKIFFALAGKAHHDIGTDGGLGHGGMDALNAILVMPGTIAAMHQAQDAVAAALQRNMGVLGDARRGRDQGDEFVAPVHGFDRTDAQQGHAGALQNGLEEIDEAGAKHGRIGICRATANRGLDRGLDSRPQRPRLIPLSTSSW